MDLVNRMKNLLFLLFLILSSACGNSDKPVSSQQGSKTTTPSQENPLSSPSQEDPQSSPSQEDPQTPIPGQPDPQVPQTNHLGSLTIEQVDAAMNAAPPPTKGPNFDKNIGSLDGNPTYTSTPMGAYLNNWFPNLTTYTEQINTAARQVLNRIGNGKRCKTDCSDEFKLKFKNDKPNLLKRFQDITREIAENEIRNTQDFNIFYHGFPSDLRLYHDVLRIVKSFEFLSFLTTTYPFRDFSFTDKHVELSNFLRGWWPAYVAYAKKQGVSPYPSTTHPSPGAAVGLTFYPDSIPYGMDYLLSTNVNFFSNNLSPLNNTPFFFLGSASATGSKKFDSLYERTLSPYVKDKDKLDKAIAKLKAIFNQTMDKSGGQLAQIFVKKDTSPKVSFIAWNGGEPMWLNKTGANKGEIAMQKHFGFSFHPINLFYPKNAFERSQFEILNVVEFMNLFTTNAVGLVKLFPAMHQKRLDKAAIYTGASTHSLRTKIYFAQDVSQARVLPNPQYFTDENVAGVKIYTVNDIKKSEIDKYNKALFELIHELMEEFLTSVHQEKDFKPGKFKLKQLFIDENSKGT